MPARSKAQQKAAGAALAAKRDPAKLKELRGASREMYETMDERQLEEFAETKQARAREAALTSAVGDATVLDRTRSPVSAVSQRTA